MRHASSGFARFSQHLWPNRLIGDAGLPEEKRLTVTNVQRYDSSANLLPSGLLGPMILRAEAALPAGTIAR